MYKILCNYILHIFQMNKKICKILEIIAYKLPILFVVNVLLATVIFNLLYFKLRSYKDSGRPLRVLVLFSAVLLLKSLYKYTIKYHTVRCGHK